MKDSQDTFSLKTKLTLSPILLLLLSIVAATLFAAAAYILWKNLPENNQVNTPIGSDSEEVSNEKAEEIAVIRNVYDTEGIPVPLTNKLGAYGLNGQVSGSPQGSLVFSGHAVSGEDSTRMFTLDLSANVKEAREYLPLFPVSGFAEFENNLTPSYLFFSTVSNASIDAFPESAQRIHQINFNNNSIAYLDEGAGLLLRRIEWAPQTQLLAFVRAKFDTQSYQALLPITNWETVVLQIDSEGDSVTDTIVTTINSATQPKWSPDGTKMLYLKEDGLYTYNVEEDAHQKIQGIVGGKRALTTSMIDVSSEGDHLIWSTPKSGVITLYEIASWDQFELRELGRIVDAGTEFYWPQFSPDGNYYVVQAIDAPEEGSTIRNNPRFEVRPTLNQEIVATYPLTDFDFDGLFTDDWVMQLPELSQ